MSGDLIYGKLFIFLQIYQKCFAENLSAKILTTQCGQPILGNAYIGTEVQNIFKFQTKIFC